MTRDKLNRILKDAIGNETDVFVFDGMYEPTYKKHTIPTSHIKRFLRFDFERHGFSCVEASVSCGGICIRFSHKNYDHLSVTCEYDYSRRTFYNYALLLPVYKPEHWIGVKSIRQTANKITSDKDFEKYKNKIDKKFSIEP
jgi:hypothetical protein